MIKAISFDCWNTIYELQNAQDITGLRIERLQRYLPDWGCVIADQTLREMLGKVWEQAFQTQRVDERDIGPAGQVDMLLEQLKLQPEPGPRAALQQEWDTVLLTAPPCLRPGVKETLAYLQPRYKIAMICNTGATPGRVLRQLLRQDGVIDYFDLLIFSDEVGDAKPGRRIYRRMLDAFGLEAREAAHIGDDPMTDVDGAHSAGLTAIWLAPADKDSPPGCDQRVTELRGLLELY